MKLRSVLQNIYEISNHCSKYSEKFCLVKFWSEIEECECEEKKLRLIEENFTVKITKKTFQNSKIEDPHKLSIYSKLLLPKRSLKFH